MNLGRIGRQRLCKKEMEKRAELCFVEDQSGSVQSSAQTGRQHTYDWEYEALQGKGSRGDLPRKKSIVCPSPERETPRK